jgi:hypothetical protein
VDEEGGFAGRAEEPFGDCLQAGNVIGIAIIYTIEPGCPIKEELGEW